MRRQRSFDLLQVASVCDWCSGCVCFLTLACVCVVGACIPELGEAVVPLLLVLSFAP